MGEQLCLLQVHAHPDDEASKGAGVTARYAAEGVRCALVTCTGGEAGDILNPAADTPETRADLPAVRLRELEDSVSILGYAALHLLGYRDSGMPDSEENKHPDAFANADIDEATGKLVAIIRAEHPQVIITYDEDQSYYPHPDHLRTHDVSVAAFEAAGDPTRFPGAGEPWQPAKLYYVGFTGRRVRALHEWLLAERGESPYQRWIDGERTWNDAPYTTRIDVGEHIATARRSLLAHRTQVAPDSFWFAVPDDVVGAVYPYEDYALARSHVQVERDDDGFETDLFSGLHAAAP